MKFEHSMIVRMASEQQSCNLANYQNVLPRERQREKRRGVGQVHVILRSDKNTMYKSAANSVCWHKSE